MRRICLLFFFLHFCILTFAGNELPPGSSINWITLWLCFFFGVLFTMLFRFLNRKIRISDQRSNAGQPLSGWIVFLGFNLIARFLIQSYFLVEGNYFLKAWWIRLEQEGGARLHTLMIFEMFLSLFSLAGTGALIYWFYGRRDIFPNMFIYYAGFYLLATVVQIIINYNMVLPAEMINIRREGYIHIIRILYIAIWVGFVWKSRQVKQTFVYPP